VSSPKRTIHILFEGYAICGFPGMPAAWPQGHVWLSKADYPTATEREVMDCCARCEAVFRERWPKEVRRVILKPLSDTEIELLVAPDHTDGGLVIRDLPLRINATLSEVAVLRVDCRRLLAAASDTGLLRDRCRRAAQMLIQEIGAQGPETLTQTAQRAVDIICALREELKQNNREGDAP